MPPSLGAAAAHGISYRPMSEADMPFVAALYASTRADELARSGWPPAMQEAFLEQQHRAQHAAYRAAHPHGEWLTVLRGDIPIGRLYLSERDGMRLLVDISLVTSARGAGIGTAILADVVADAGERAVTLHVEAGNPARRLYERAGFRVSDDQGAYLRMVRAPGGQ